MGGNSKLRLWLVAAVFILLTSVPLVFAPAWGEGGGGGGLVAPSTTVDVESDRAYIQPGDSHPVNVSFKVANVSDVTSLALLLPFDPERVTPVDADSEEEGVQPWLSAKFLGVNPFENLVTDDNKASLREYTSGVPAAAGDTPKKLAVISFTIKPGAPDGTFTINPTYTNSQNDIVQLVDSQSHFISYTAQPLDVIIDGTDPVINLDQTPEEVNEEQAGTNVVTISGTVQEANLDAVKVNGQLATLNGNGFNGFTCDVSLQDGDNAINVVATDKAGNSSSAQCNIKFIASKPAAPTADPVPGAYAGGVVVRLSTTTVGAQVYYTKDGSNPLVVDDVVTNGNLYTDKIIIESNTTIKAIAIKDGKTSVVAAFEYVIEPAGVGDDSLNQLAQELVKLYSNMDTSDKAALEAAKTTINDPGVNWEQLLAPVLNNLTDEAKNALGAGPCANLRNFILDGLNIYYTPNTNVDQVAQQLKIFRSTYKPMITGVFDGGVTVENIWNFILAVQDAVPGQFTDQDLEDLLNEGFAIIEKRLQEWLNGAIDETFEKHEYQVFKEKLAGVGLTRDILIQTKDNLFNAAEPDLSAGQAVVKAYVRSRVVLTGKTTLLVGNIETYQLKALGVDLASLLKWHSSDTAVADFTDNTKPGKLLAITPGTITVTAYWEKGGLGKAWLKKFNVTVTNEPEEVVATVTGKVIKQDGTSFEGVSVQLWQSGQLKLEKKTDPQGTFSFSEVAPGVYELVAFAPGYLKTTINIELSPEREIYKEIRLAPTNPSDLDGNGRVNDADLELFMSYYWQAREGMPYDSVYDLFQDEKIDLKDLVIAGKSFGYSIQ